MRLASFRPRTGDMAPRVGHVVGDPGALSVVALTEGTSLVALLALDPPSREHAVAAASLQAYDLSEVHLLPPVYPVAMRDFFTFEKHVEGTAKAVQGVTSIPPEWYAAPGYFFMAPHAVHGAHDDIAMPPDTERLDYELELAVVVCRDGRNLTEEQAARCIGG